MKTVVDTVSQGAAVPTSYANLTVGQIVRDIDSSPSNHHVFETLTRSENEFVMSLQVDGVLTLADYALKGLLAESYIFSHLPLRVKTPMGEKLKAGIAKVFSLQKAKDFVEGLEESLVHSEQNLKDCDIDFPLRQYLLDICGYEEDAIHIREFPTDLKVQHYVSLRIEMKRFFKSTGLFHKTVEGEIVWSWASQNAAFLRQGHVVPSIEPVASVEVTPRETTGRLWFEHFDLELSSISNEGIVKIQSAWRMKTGSLRLGQRRSAVLKIQSLWRQVCVDAPSPARKPLSSYTTALGTRAMGPQPMIFDEEGTQSNQPPLQKFSTIATASGACSCVLLATWWWPPFLGLLMVTAFGTWAYPRINSIQLCAWEWSELFKCADGSSVNLEQNDEIKDSKRTPSRPTATAVSVSTDIAAPPPAASAGTVALTPGLDDWIKRNKLQTLSAPLNIYVSELHDVIELTSSDLDELIAEYKVARIPARRLREAVENLQQQPQI
jgi:hypothetical protein